VKLLTSATFRAGRGRFECGPTSQIETSGPRHRESARDLGIILRTAKKPGSNSKKLFSAGPNLNAGRD